MGFWDYKTSIYISGYFEYNNYVCNKFRGGGSDGLCSFISPMATAGL